MFTVPSQFYSQHFPGKCFLMGRGERWCISFKLKGKTTLISVENEEEEEGGEEQVPTRS